MSKAVTLVALDGTTRTLEVNSDLFVFAPPGVPSLREIAVADLLVEEVDWVTLGQGFIQEVPKSASLLDVESHGQPSQPEVTKK